MDSSKKKAIRDAYKEKLPVGGICQILCSGNGRTLVQATRDIDSLRNRFDFAISIGSCPDPSLRAEYDAYGAGSFTFSVLEEIKKTESQTAQEYWEDVQALLEIWKENKRGQ